MGKYLVGCDVGTGGTKAVVMSEDGAVLGSHYIEYPLIVPRPGWAEHHPDTYWNAVADTIRESIRQSKVDPKDIKGVSISALSPACILVDKDMNPLQNAHIWMDRRATKETEWLKEHIGEDRVFKLTGNPIDPYYAITKLMWEKNNRPDLYKRAYKLQTAADYPVAKLTGRAVTDYSNASLIGIAFDIVNKKWDEKLLDEIGIDVEKLPDAFPCDEVIGEVTREAAERTGLAPGTPVVAGTVDCNAAWVAGGALHDGDSSLVLGTAGVLGIVHTEPKFTKDMITIVHTANSKETYTTLAALVSAGGFYRYLRDTLGHYEKDVAKILEISAFDLLNIEASKAPVGSKGLIVLPYMAGERTPIWDAYARGVFFGLSLAHTKGDIIRGVIEGIGYALRHNFELIKQSGVRINLPMVISEGMAVSPLVRQILSDILGIDFVFMESNLGAPVGNAINAGVGVGIYKDYDVVKNWIKITDKTMTNLENKKVYDKLFDIFLGLYPKLKEDFKKLAFSMGYE